MTHYTIEGTMTYRPGATTSRFKFAVQASTIGEAIEEMEKRLRPERGYKITAIDAVAIQGYQGF